MFLLQVTKLTQRVDCILSETQIINELTTEFDP